MKLTATDTSYTNVFGGGLGKKEIERKSVFAPDLQRLMDLIEKYEKADSNMLTFGTKSTLDEDLERV